MMRDGLRLAFGLLTVFPQGSRSARTPGRASRPSRKAAAAAMALAPAVGMVLGTAAAAVLVAASLLLRAGALLSAALAIAALALLTRGLHLDGLADLADGLGSGKAGPEALDIMTRSDIGPFGVATLVLSLLIQVAALAQAQARGFAASGGHGFAASGGHGLAASGGHGAVALLTATVTGRLAIAWACRRGVPAARQRGLGALVAGTLPTAVPAAATLAFLGLAALGGWLLAGPSGGWLLTAGIAAGLGASLALTRHAVRRFGGITGDVLGGLAETAMTVCLIVTAA